MYECCHKRNPVAQKNTLNLKLKIKGLLLYLVQIIQRNYRKRYHLIRTWRKSAVSLLWKWKRMHSNQTVVLFGHIYWLFYSIILWWCILHRSRSVFTRHNKKKNMSFQFGISERTFAKPDFVCSDASQISLVRFCYGASYPVTRDNPKGFLEGICSHNNWLSKKKKMKLVFGSIFFFSLRVMDTNVTRFGHWDWKGILSLLLGKQ